MERPNMRKEYREDMTCVVSQNYRDKMKEARHFTFVSSLLRYPAREEHMKLGR